MGSTISRINWPQLVIELVIVVGGILIALAIDSWWADRGAAHLERAFLDQLLVDLRQAELQLAEEVQGTERAGQAVINLLEVARGDRTAASDSIAQWVTMAGWFGEPVTPLSTAQALGLSESLFVVRDASLRSGIVRLLDRLRFLEARIQPMENRIFDFYGIVNQRLDPIERGQALYVGVSDGGLQAFAEVQRPAEDLPRSWAPLLDDPEFRGKFTDLFWVHENLRWLQQAMLDVTTEIRAQLESEMNR